MRGEVSTPAVGAASAVPPEKRSSSGMYVTAAVSRVSKKRERRWVGLGRGVVG